MFKSFQSRFVKATGLAALSLSLGACGASPEAVCDNEQAMYAAAAAKAGLSGEAAQAVTSRFDRHSCLFTWKMKHETLGVFQYRSLSNCMASAATLDDATKCSVK